MRQEQAFRAREAKERVKSDMLYSSYSLRKQHNLQQDFEGTLDRLDANEGISPLHISDKDL